MNLAQRSNAFIELGRQLKSVATNRSGTSKFGSSLTDIIENAKNLNGWFTTDNVVHAINCIAESLEEDKLIRWLQTYDEEAMETRNPKRIGVLMAGNIPLVGFHDMLCVLISAHHFVGKASSKDGSLINGVANLLIDIEPAFDSRIEFEKNSFSSIEAIIATGSDNASTYIQYYFDKYPNLIRKNRNSVAILTGNESKQELELLGEDIFRYFGLGCRNVTKIYVPRNYDFDILYDALFKYSDIIQHNKYANNYDYNKAILLLDKVKLLDNGFLLLKEGEQVASPVGTLHYEYYDSTDDLYKKVHQVESDKIQCLVSNDQACPEAVPFGSTQNPQLWEYADGVDTLEFLINLPD